MKKQFIILITLLSFFSITNSHAKSITIESLGSLDLKFEIIERINHIPTQKTIGEAAVKDGEIYVLTTPTNVQKITFLVSNGEMLKKNQPFAVLTGPEVHHFLSELKAAKVLFELAEQRMKNNKKLFKKNLIEEKRWLEINQNYYSTSLEYEHMMHFYELVGSIDEANDSIVINAPIAGILKRNTTNHSLNTPSKISEGDIIAQFIPERALRLKIRVSADNTSSLEYINLKHCKLKVESIGKIAQGAFVDVWTEQLSPTCHLLPGQTQLVQPLYKQSAFKVSKQAIFTFEGKDSILIRHNQNLKLVTVALITASDNQYILTSDVDLSGVELLTSSVSAAQGLLIGLGGE